MYYIKIFYYWINWNFRGRPYNKIFGFHCGCCGKWVNNIKYIPDYNYDSFFDGWGLCNSCKNFKE